MTSLVSFFTHKFFKILLSIYLGLFIIIWLISSPVIKHFISPILAEQQLHLSGDSSIQFNPFLMRVTLNNIELISTKVQPEEGVFSLSNMQIQVALWQLAFDKVVLSKFVVTDGNLKISQHDNKMVIAGIEIPSKAEKSDGDAPAEQAPADLPYQLLLPDLLLSQFHIELVNVKNQTKHKTHHIEIEQLALSQVKATQSEQEANLALAALIDETHLSLSAKTHLTAGKGDIESNLRLDNYPIEKLSRYVEQLSELKGSLSFSSQQKVTLGENDINFSVDKAKVNLKDVLVGLPEQRFTLKAFQQDFSDLAISLQDNNITHLAGDSSIKFSEALVTQVASKATVAAFKQLALDKIQFVLDDEPSIDIANIVLDDVLFSKKAALTDAVAQKAIDKINKLSADDGIDISAEEIVKLPPVLKLKQLAIHSVHIHEKSIAINDIVFDTLTGNVIIKEDKSLANLVSLDSKTSEPEPSPTQETKPTTTEVSANTKEDDFIFSLQGLRFINENALGFTDFSVNPIYQRTLFLDTLEVGAISNKKEKRQEKTPFTLKGRSNKYANFDLAGYLQPFINSATYHVKGDFKEFSLPAISTYLKPSTGLEIKTGQLNTALNVTLTGEELDGNVVVLLQALETGLVDSEEAGSLIDQGALPLNMAMGMLKDSDGNVELDVPLSGSTSDPSFGLSSIVTLITKKAIMSATQDYLMTTFVPYANIVSIAITAGEFALKLRFDDLEYQEKQVEPNQQQDAYLKDFIALMHDKEDTRVTICAISIPADIGLKAGVAVTDKSHINRLIKLGEAREHAFKDHLIEQGKIESSRILFCKPQIDSDEGAVPRIAISV